MGLKILRGGFENFYTPERGALKKLGGGGGLRIFVYFKPKRRGGGGFPKKLNR